MKKESKASPMVDSDDTWKYESDARTLAEATEILNDPERLKNAKKFHGKKKKSMRSVDDLIKHRNDTFGAPKASKIEIEIGDEEDED